jgi:hypothetical protein
VFFAVDSNGKKWKKTQILIAHQKEDIDGAKKVS